MISTIKIFSVDRIDRSPCESHQLKRYRKNCEADEHNRNGNYLLSLGKYHRAADQFTQAYEKSSDYNPFKKGFKENLKMSQAEIYNLEGDQLITKKKYYEAINRFKSAVDRCPANKREKLKKMQTNLTNAKNSFADELGNKGSDYFHRKNFHKAAQKFKQATKECDTDYSNKQSFVESMELAEAEILNSEGEHCLFFKNYTKAVTKFQSAFERCPTNRTSSRIRFQSNMMKSEADILNLKGDDLMKKQKYSQALEMYLSALERCPVDKTLSRSKFQNNIQRTIEIIAS